jgi:hypothetical protein
MMFSLRLCYILRAVVVVHLAIALPSLAAMTMQVSMETRNTPNISASNTPGNSQKLVELTLAPQYIAMKSATEQTIFDFKTRKRIVMDLATKQYVNYSLYDAVGFRAYELKNRQMLGGALAAAQITATPMAGVDSEHILSVASPTPTKFEESVDGGALVFSHTQRTLARWSKSGTAVSDSELERFTKFVRYTQGGHPQLLARLASGTVIPDQLVLTFTEVWGTRTHLISVKDVRRKEDDVYDLRGYTLRKNGVSGGDVDAVLDRAANLSPQAIQAALVDHRAGMASALQNGQYLDALLGSLEWSLMTGQPLPPFTTEQLAQIRTDASAQLLMRALGAKTRDEFVQAVPILVELRSKSLLKPHVLKIFEANNRLQLQQPAAARVLFVEALQANLLVAGAYKDLGDLLLMGYDMPRAWRCWDMGRQLAPDFVNFGPVNQYEKSLATQYPEYF